MLIKLFDEINEFAIFLKDSISCTQNDNNQADLIRELIKQKFKWDKIYQYSLITK